MPFSEISRVKPAAFDYDEDESKQLSEALADPKRAPDEVDALLAGSLARAMGRVTPQRELERQERIRREGELHAQGQQQAQEQAPEEEDEAYPGGMTREQFEAWLDEED